MQQKPPEIELLVEQLHELRDVHEQLLLAARSKQSAMRAGDVDALQSWSAREQFLVDRIAAAEQQRRAIVDALAQTLHLEGPVTLTLLAGKLEEPDRSRLLALAGAIRSLAEQIRQTNQINDAVTREILQCFAQMQQQYAVARCDIGLYDTSGHKQLVTGVPILDAVG